MQEEQFHSNVLERLATISANIISLTDQVKVQNGRIGKNNERIVELEKTDQHVVDQMDAIIKRNDAVDGNEVWKKREGIKFVLEILGVLLLGYLTFKIGI